MAANSPVLLAYPTGTNTSSGIFIPGAVSHLGGEGLATNFGSIGVIPCSGYDELHFTPLAEGSAATPAFAVFAYYGNQSNGGDHDIYTVKLLLSMTCATTSPVLPVTWFDGTVYHAKNPTVTAAYTAVLDGVVGCTTTTQTGSSTVMGNVGISHLGGADFIAITCASVAGSNGLVRFT